MNYGTIKKVDVANGPGVRVSLFVSGCRNHCIGCFNPETWDFDYGKPFTRETEEEIIEALRPSWIQGLSILGGEPTEEENEKVLIPFLKRVRAELPEKDIWLYSGYTWEMLQGEEILQLVDVLVDGPFLQEQKDAGLAFRGSRNQRIIRLEKGRPV
ncbi:MAG: anaerobic ribonucleoside-triphosphate reductase activating protein [Clostridium sp.]|nr:anaerobic ribonucleoside-triphosphate reductase activating protein [Clostridium sp.]